MPSDSEGDAGATVLTREAEQHGGNESPISKAGYECSARRTGWQSWQVC